MKRSIPFLLVLVLALTAGITLLPDSTNEYVPREGGKAQLASGAREIQQSLLADPTTGEINYDYIKRVNTEISRMAPNANARNLGYDWISAGPNNVGGRTRAIMTYEENPQRAFTGSVSGGLFQSFNGGEEWSRVESFNDNIAVASIARTGNGKIFVGTGHFAESPGSATGSLNSNNLRGNGLYVSEDDGATWNIVQDFSPSSTFSTSSIWARVNVLMADPNNANRVWIAHTGGLSTYDWGDEDRVERIGDGATSLSISDNGQVIIATANDKVYVSTDAGENFTLRSGSNFGQIPSSGIGRIEVAVSPDDPNYMYALAAATNGYLKGVYASTNMGQTWYQLYGSSNNGSSPFSPFSVAEQGQGTYDNAITVIPGTPTQAIIGGIRMYLIEITGQNPPSPQWNALNVNFSQGPNPGYVHSDIHTFHWDANDVFYIGCDGGIFKTLPGGNGFVSRNYNYRTTQFYGMDFNNDGQVIAGAQDNGTHLISGFNISNNDSEEIGSGDGFDCVLSKVDPKIAFGTVYFNQVMRSFDGGISGGEIVSDNPDNPLFYPGPFWTIIDMDERLDAPNTTAQTFPWGNVYLEQDSGVDYNGTNYVEGDTIAFTDDFCLSGVQYSNEDTLIVELEDYPYYLAPGASHPYVSESYNIPYEYTNNTGDKLYAFCDVVPAPDPAQSLFCVGGSGSFRMTRDATKTTVGSGEIDWVEVSDGVGSTITCFEFSPDHDNLYIGNSQGSVYRVSGLNNAYTAEALALAAEGITTIYAGGGRITDLAVDANNNNRLLITKSGYSSADKLFISEEATTTTSSSSFDAIWNFPSDLSLMPAYSCTFDINYPNRILVGTEYGVWVSDDLGDNWEECNLNMGRVPVYTLEQQVLTTQELQDGLQRDDIAVLNEGAMYAGTFGKGLYYVGDYVLGIDDLDNEAELVTNLSVYPNPAYNQTALKLSLVESNLVTIQVFDMNGRLVTDLPQGKMLAGEYQIDLNISSYSEGTYLIRVQAGEQAQNIRFIVSK